MKNFVFVKISPGKEKEVIEALKSVDGVTHAQLLYGAHDAIAEVSASHTELKGILLDKIRPIEGVEGTKTYLSAL